MILAFLILSTSARAESPYRQATDAEEAGLRAIARWNYFPIGATTSLIQRASIDPKGAAADGKAWILGAGHSLVGVAKPFVNGKRFCNVDLRPLWGQVQFSKPRVTFPHLQALYQGDPQLPSEYVSGFRGARVVLASLYPVDTMIVEIDVPESTLVRDGIQPWVISGRVPQSGEPLWNACPGDPYGRYPSVLHSVIQGSLLERLTQRDVGLSYYTDLFGWAGCSGGPVFNASNEVVGTVEGGGKDSRTLPNGLDVGPHTFVSPTSWIREVMSPAGDVDCARFEAKMRQFEGMVR